MVNGLAQLDIVDDPKEIARVKSPKSKPFLRISFLESKQTVDVSLSLGEMIGGAAKGARERFEPFPGDPSSGYNVRNADIESQLRGLGRLIKSTMPENWGFTLLMFNFGAAEKPGDGLFYLSSAEREDMLNVMREFIQRHTQ